MQKLFQKYIKGTCSKSEFFRVKDFIENKKNEVFLDGLLLASWRETFKEQQTIQPDPDVLNLIHHEITIQESAFKSKRIKYYQTAISAVAVVVFVLLFGVLYYLDDLKPEILSQNITTPYGGKTQFTLPDGSVVWLNSGSTFTFPDRFEDERIVELKGEGYFDVEKQNIPFKVKTRYGIIEVLGTRFNVKAYDSESFCTTLESGAVLFTNIHGNKAKLEPGMQVVFDSTEFKLRYVETDLFTSWKDGQLIFRNEPLKNIIPQLERWYNVKIELRDERIKNLKFNGTIEMESFSEVLELIKVTTPIKYSFDRETRILKISAP